MSNSITEVIFAVGAQKIVQDFGHALPSCKGSFADVSELPYPKSVIKVAILAALSIAGDTRVRERLKAAFVSLADWQEGIGPGPHDLDAAQRPGETIQELAKRISQTAPAFMALSKRVTTEMEGLLAELKSLGL